MKTQFLTRGFQASASLQSRLGQGLERLQALIAISAAAIVLERRRDHTPAFRGFVLLAVPGPDIHAEAHDHTLEAVWLKVTASLRKQIERRKARQHAARGKKSCGFRAPAIRRAGSLVGARA